MKHPRMRTMIDHRGRRWGRERNPPCEAVTNLRAPIYEEAVTDLGIQVYEEAVVAMHWTIRGVIKNWTLVF
jgi:hypothetical protein